MHRHIDFNVSFRYFSCCSFYSVSSKLARHWSLLSFLPSPSRAAALFCSSLRPSLPPAGRKHDKARTTSECSPAETRYSKCVPDKDDCGDGLREVTCNDRTDKIRCRIPCNWKKEISERAYTQTHAHIILGIQEATLFNSLNIDYL